MAVKRTRAEARAIKREIKKLDRQIKKVLKKAQKLKRDIDSKFGVFKHANPFDWALFIIALAVDLLLTVFGLITLELLDFIDWIIEFGMYFFLGLAGFAMILTSPRAGKQLPLTLVLFILSFIIEIVPGFSVLPAIAGFAARIIYVVNKAKLEVRVDELKKEKKKLLKRRGQLKALLTKGGKGQVVSKKLSLQDLNKSFDKPVSERPMQPPNTMRIGHTVSGGVLERKYGSDAAGSIVNPNSPQYKQAA